MPIQRFTWGSCLIGVFVQMVASHAVAQSTISGRIAYHSNDAPLVGITVNLIGPSNDSTITDSNGVYQFTNLAPGTWQVVPTKNGDERGSITAIDGSVELNCAVGNITPTQPQRLSCDVNASSSLTAFDAVHILDYRVSNVTILQVAAGCGSNWAFIPTAEPTAGQTPIAPLPNRTPTLCRQGAIAFDNLNGDATNQNFAALLFGDCSANWPNPSRTPTPSATQTATPSITATATETGTPTPTGSQTSTRTPTHTPTHTPTRTDLPTASETPTRTPTITRTPTNTPTPSQTPFGGIPWPTLSEGTTFTGLSAPVYVTHADNGDGNSRTFVVLQDGIVRLIKNGVLQPTAFLNIGPSGAQRTTGGGEQGLLSIAIPPGYASKRYFYVNYTNNSGNTVIARYQLDSVSNDIANVNSEQILLPITQPFSNHNGGQLQFGPDGYLYIGMGDGGDSNDPQNQAQNSTSLLGKILRIDVESPVTTPTPYLIPASNPTPNATFTRTPGYRREIWASGVRNPWRFSFDRLTGDLYIGDVGQGAWEEVDFQAAGSSGGQNYGWRLWEGNHTTVNCSGCTSTGFTFPVTEYQHVSGNCSITGGFVYRGANPCMHGTYFYADYCSGRIWGLRQSAGVWQSQQLLDTLYNITCFGEDAPGNLYFCDASNGRIVQLADACVAPTLTPTSTPTPTQTPPPSTTPTPTPT